MPDPDPTPDDLVVSAVLDGEASPAEAERVASDPRLAARLAQLRAVASAVGGPVPLVDPAVREAHLAAALAEMHRLAADPPVTDAPAAADAPPPSPAPVDLAAARSRRRPTASRVVLSVAAALLVVVAAGAVLVRLGDLGGSGGSDEVATEADESRSSADSLGAAEGGADDGADSEAFTPEAGDASGEDTATPTTTADAPSSAAGAAIDPELVSLGTFAKAEDLTAAVRGRLVLDPTPEAAGEDPTCQDDFPVETTLLGRATVGGEEGLVYVDAVPGSGRQVWFVDPATPGTAGEACRRIVPVDTI